MMMPEPKKSSDVLLRLTRRTDLPADVIATLYHAAEAVECELHEAYQNGIRDGEIAEQNRHQTYMVSQS